ncbi:MAG: hypothetical protein CMB53_03840 [Euryarchaeota archaeon]|nr:hypothetical protein [Euryarchaeota archaeon]
MRPMETEVGCVVLAAGSSQRLGQPKALVDLGEVNLVGWVVGRLVKHGLNPVVVTNESIFEDVLVSTGCDVVCNPDPDLGRTGTVQLGIRRIGLDQGRKFLIVPVDRPGFSGNTLSSLLTSRNTTCPSKEGRGGHPILLSEDDASRILEALPSVPLRDLVVPERMEVSDPFLHLNVDVPSDLGRLNEAFAELE